ARIHRTNLINCGIAPLVCNTAGIDQGDRLKIELGNLKGDVRISNQTKGTEIAVHPDWTDREMNILRAGGILAFAKEEIQR
ncbi:MAG: aconitate hydratase, partial [Candidatus Latescibacterota bacterium]